MKLDLTEIVLHLGKRISYTINEPPIEDLETGVKCVEPVTGELTFSNAGNHIVARGHFSTKVAVECGRCLEDFPMDVNLPIEEAFPIPGHVPEMIEDDEEPELPEEEKEPLFEENILDLTELLRQNIAVAVPIKPLCDDLCKGLCSQCGQNLNEGQCACPPEVVNDAFAGLATLLEQDEEKESEA